MKNNVYWKGRFAQLEQVTNQTGAAFYQSVEEQYYKAQKTIESQISTWYQRFAVNNQISMGEARKLLTTKELSEFKWDVTEYIKYGELNAVDGAWMKQLENASARYHISRLEALKYQTQQSMEVLFGNQMDGLDTLAKQIYSNGYYHSIYEIQKGVGVGWGIASIDQNRLEKIISKPWAADGRNFSDRIWKDKTRLTNELHTQLTQNCILGKGPDATIKNIAKSMNTSRVNAGRLVMTESAFFESAAQRDAFNELDVEQFEIVATLDSHTSAICQELDGKVFEMKEYEAGATAPPFHVGCRSTTVPHFDDEWNVGERAARGEDGKTYYVPDSMKYKEWKETFVDGGEYNFINKEVLENVNNIDTMAYIKSELALIPYKHIGLINDAVKKIQVGEGSHFNRKTGILQLDSNPIKGELIHEFGHAIETQLELYYNKTYISIRNRGLETVLPNDIESIIYGDKDIQILNTNSKKFISVYQRAIYTTDIDGNGLIDYSNKCFNWGVLGEYFSEGYREYLVNPSRLKECDIELFNFIKGLGNE